MRDSTIRTITSFGIAAFVTVAVSTPVYAGEFDLSWANMNWPSGSTGPQTFTLTDEYGFEIDLRISITRIGGVTLAGYPNDGTAFGTLESLLLAWDPNFGNGNVGDSTNTVTFEILSGGSSFSVDNLTFEISDIDSVDNNSTTDRCDFVTLTGNAGNPALSLKLAPSASTSVIVGPATGSGLTGAIAANQAQCIYNTGAPTSPNSNGDDNGTIDVDYPSGTHTVTIAYDESMSDIINNNNINPAARGIGVFSGAIASANTAISLSKSTTATDFVGVGDVVPYTYTITNDSTLPINTGQNIQIDDDKIGTFTCGTISADIPVGGTHSCTANYTITAADVTAGQVTNIATAGLGTGTQAFVDRLASNTDQVTLYAERDFSDAPIVGTSYGDATHQISSGIYLGASVDADARSLANSDASGDDSNGTDDEDGVNLPSLYQGSSETLYVDVSGTGGFLQAWIDWDNDGSFGAGDQIATDLQDNNSDGQIEVPVDIPSSAPVSVFARFRWSTTSGLDHITAAPDGEVEDYAFNINPVSIGNLTCPVGYTVVAQSGNAGTVITAARDSNSALGALSPAGTSTNTTNSARNVNSDPILGLQLEHMVPAGAPITVSVAKNNNGANSDIETSAVNGGYANQLTFNIESQDTLQRRTIVAPAGGVEFIQFNRNSGSLWIDGVSYNYACNQAGSAQLTGSKSVAIWDPDAEDLYALPGNDMIYTISGVNTGDGPTDNNSIVLIDTMPSEVEFYNGDIDDDGPNTDPVSFAQTAGAGLSFTYATDVGYSNSAARPATFADCTYTPVAGYDVNVTYICFNPKGTLASGDPDPNFQVSFRGRIK